MKKGIVRQAVFGFAIMLMGSVAQAEMGTFDSNQRQYYPRTCELNGTDAICTFAVVNRGPSTTMQATGRLGAQILWGDLTGIQFIDNAKVPHHPSAAYFLDKFGTRQPAIVLPSGEQGWYVLEFPNVDSRVTTGYFQFNNRSVGEITVTKATYTPPVAGAPPVNRGADAAPITSPQTAPVAAAAPPAQTSAPSPEAAAPLRGCPPNDKACEAAEKMNKVQSATENTSKAVENTAKAVDNTTKTIDATKGLFKSLGGLFGKSEPAPQSVQFQQAPPQQAQPQQ